MRSQFYERTFQSNGNVSLVSRNIWQQVSSKLIPFRFFTDGLRKTCGGRLIPRTKMKTLKMSCSIVITFIVCWTPYFVVYNLLIFSNYSMKIPESIMVIADTLALTNSVLNPVIYSCYNMKIKQGLSDACCLRFEYVIPWLLPNFFLASLQNFFLVNPVSWRVLPVPINFLFSSFPYSWMLP